MQNIIANPNLQDNLESTLLQTNKIIANLAQSVLFMAAGGGITEITGGNKAIPSKVKISIPPTTPKEKEKKEEDKT